MPPKSITDLTLVKELLDTVGGEDAITVVKLCEKKRKMTTDEELSKKMKKKVTEVRAILNKLHFRGIACYQKARNQKTGWYNYTWEIKKDRIAEIIEEQQKENLEKLNNKMKLEADYSLFDCTKCNHREVFEVAAEYNFICPTCGGNMTSANDPNRQKELLTKIKNIEKELTLLNKMK
ncbi:MAG: Transcription factor E [archaeon ADurb.Bin336]|nr:MAG: Transcription factor E [archaeon ADurb.Bin336]